MDPTDDSRRPGEDSEAGVEMMRVVTPAAGKVVALCTATAAPYIALKTYWAFGGRAGLADGFDLVDEFEKNGAPDALVWLERHGIDFTAVLALTGVMLAFALVRPRGRRLPRWLLFTPALAGTLLIPYGLLTAVLALTQNGSNAAPAITQWVAPAGVGAFLGIGTALGVGAWSRLNQAVSEHMPR
ncbi:hypothetical protein J1792_31270 [Streptomyces triculaminicus]|uniref:Uncharacterized protein n=1 Tax=Streptomyces triculaminicus TaxID=2816232 RepID=A0A939JTL8_9ACTN|nr:hypothetical protein [Streptomyces triculaminicus]MBO0657057.1 hypothetical protein [Streptomyces triculaminicus]